MRHVFRSYAVVLASFIQSLTMGLGLRRAFARFGNEEDVIIAMDTVFTPIAVRCLERKVPYAKYVLSVRGPHAEMLSRRFPVLTKIFRKMEISALDRAPLIWANGYDTVEWLKELGYDSILVPNGVDVEHIRNSKPIADDPLLMSDSFKVISIGTLLEVKGIRELLRAATELISGGMKDLEVLFVGKGNPQRFERVSEDLGIREHVHFLGEKYEVVPYLKASQIAACLSEGSGLSMAALESLASGIPVIAWDTPVYRQMIRNGATGYLVPFKNIYALADAILEVRNDYVKWLKIGRIASRTVEKYDWVNIASRITESIGGL